MEQFGSSLLKPLSSFLTAFLLSLAGGLCRYVHSSVKKPLKADVLLVTMCLFLVTPTPSLTVEAEPRPLLNGHQKGSIKRELCGFSQVSK